VTLRRPIMQHLHPSFRIFISAFALIVMIAASIVMVPSTPVAQAQGPGSGMTSLVLQNLDPNSTMNAKVTYFDTNGAAMLSTLRTVTPYRSVTIDQPLQLGLPTNFSGSGTLDADTPFGGVVMEYNGVASTQGTSFRMDGYTAWPGTDASSTAIFPQLFKNIYDPGSGVTYNSRLLIQNSKQARA
jgi:hypothetical protein